jgi:hypothetical protein
VKATIYYDGACPFCTRYARYQRLQRNLDELLLIDLRTAPREKERLQGLGFDLDKGMVVDLDGVLHGGDEAVHRLALLSSGGGVLGWLNRAALGSRWSAALLYPALRLGRNATLVALGRQRIAEDDAGERAWQTLFGMAWGLFAYLHVLVYAWQFGATMWVTTWAIAPLGVALFFFPLSRRVFLLLLACMMVDAWRQMPSLSNHTILKNAFLLALLLSGIWHALRGGRWRDFLADAAPIGRAALICMYIFGVFHKINSDFLNPVVSCAVVLWADMPGFLRWVDVPAFHYLAIFGTLVIESVILFCLLLRRTRHAGIIFGIGFHALLAMSGYAIYAPFSTLTIALHLLFLDRASARQIVASPFWDAGMTWLRSPFGLSAMALWLGAMAWLAANGSFGSVGVLWLPLIALLCYVIARYGRANPIAGQGVLWSRRRWLNCVTVLFFLGCVSPYLGLKTAQSMNMFANLRLEGGVSNHLVFRNAPAPFAYLADVVEIVESRGSAYLAGIHSRGLRVTYYDLLDKLDRNPRVRVSFRRNGEFYTAQDAVSMSGEIDRVLHPSWARRLFHFNPVDVTSPKPCALDR